MITYTDPTENVVRHVHNDRLVNQKHGIMEFRIKLTKYKRISAKSSGIIERIGGEGSDAIYKIAYAVTGAQNRTLGEFSRE